MTKTKDFILNDAKDKGVKFVRLQFTDLFGQLKNVEIPVSQLGKALDNDMMFDGSSIEGFTRIEESDMLLYPDYNTWLVLPWELENNYRVARLICDVYTPDRKPFAGDPRNILKKVLVEAEELGLKLYVGPEPEFFLFKKDLDGNVTTQVNDLGGYFDLAPIDVGENCRRDIVLALEEMGFEVEASHHEVAIGQHEIDFKYDEALKTCDNIQTFKLVVKNVAEAHNLHATFMPKPIFGVNGSGMHCNMSLFKGNQNAFFDPTTENQLSELANQFIAGILEHAKASAAVTNQLVNSYKRIVPGYEAPVNIAWSTSNRSCMIRIPASRGLGTRVEARHPDPSTNPYLAIAVLLKAGLDGIKKQLPVPAERKQNLFALSEAEKVNMGIDSLPGSLKDALKALKEDKTLSSVLGEHALKHFVEGKEAEAQEFAITVTDWELAKYLNN